MLMGDADKENNYRQPSVPHVQAVRVQCPLKPPRIFSAAAARPKKTPPALPPAEGLKRVRSSGVHAPGRQEGHGPARRGLETPKAGEPAARRHHQSTYHAPPTQEAARLGHAQQGTKRYRAGRKLSGPVRGRGGRARCVARRGTW